MLSMDPKEYIDNIQYRYDGSCLFLGVRLITARAGFSSQS